MPISLLHDEYKILIFSSHLIDHLALALNFLPCSDFLIGDPCSDPCRPLQLQRSLTPNTLPQEWTDAYAEKPSVCGILQLISGKHISHESEARPSSTTRDSFVPIDTAARSRYPSPSRNFPAVYEGKQSHPTAQIFRAPNTTLATRPPVHTRCKYPPYLSACTELTFDTLPHSE